jgi:hypothetical protein
MYSPFLRIRLRLLATSLAVSLAASRLVFAGPDDVQQVIQRVKILEQSVGYKPTGNFTRTDPHTVAYYRCYFTGIRELPESYNELRLRKGTVDGCAIDQKKYDVFFYPIEAVATGHTPVTQALEAAPAERVAVVVPHEDFHAQLRGLPDSVAEAAATLVGLATAAVALEDVAADVDVFLQKAELINRYYERLAGVYKSEHDKDRVMREKRELLASLQSECAAIRPEPRTFNKCVSAPNNTGLAFDHTYTKYYPLLYRVFRACGRDLPCTIQKIESAPKNQREADVASYFAALASGSLP